LDTVDPWNLTQIMLAEGKEMTKQAESAQRVKILSEATIFVALSIVLKDVLPPIWHMPQGGSITIAGLVPLIWFSLRRGAKWGIFAGFVYGLVHALLPGSYIIHPFQENTHRRTNSRHHIGHLRQICMFLLIGSTVFR
jgi:uncharacterized membrane protein